MNFMKWIICKRYLKIIHVRSKNNLANYYFNNEREIMKKDYSKLADSIIENIGCAENVVSLFHCATRLRFALKNKDLVKLDALKSTNDVMGVVDAADGYQVIIGNDVSKVYDEIVKKYNLKTLPNSEENLDNNVNVFQNILNTLSTIIGPAIPLILCSGLVSALLVIFTKLGLSPESTTYTILSMAGNIPLYFLPVLIGFTSSKRFNTDTMLSVFFSLVLVSPVLLGLASSETPVTLFGLPVVAADYSSSLVPIILTIWAFKYVEKFVKKIVPSAVKFVFVPLLCIFIMLPIELCLTAPLGNYVGQLLLSVMTWINNVAPWASVLVVGALAPVLVLTGMHFALIPIVFAQFASVGYDSMLFVAFIGMNFSQFGVSLACAIKSKNANLKSLATSCAVTSFLAGVTEPTLYGICVRMKKPLIATWIACVANAVFCAITKVKVFSFGAPSFFTMPIFMNPDGSMANFYFAIAAAALTIVVSFAATWILGFDDSVYGE